MPVLDRLGSLLNADLHAVLDKLEDPLASFKLAVREMEQALRETNRKLERRRCRLASLQQQERACETQLEDFAKQLDVCFDSGEDALAKSILRNKLSGEKRLAVIQRALAVEQTEIAKDEEIYAENTRRLNAMREKLDLLSHEAEPDPETDYQFDTDLPAITEDAVEVAFLREKQRRAS